MQVAVAGVKDIGHAQPTVTAHLGDPAQDKGQFADRDRPVQTDVIGNVAHGAKGRFAAQPDAAAFILRPAFAVGNGVVAQRNLP